MAAISRARPQRGKAHRRPHQHQRHRIAPNLQRLTAEQRHDEDADTEHQHYLHLVHRVVGQQFAEDLAGRGEICGAQSSLRAEVALADEGLRKRNRHEENREHQPSRNVLLHGGGRGAALRCVIGVGHGHRIDVRLRFRRRFARSARWGEARQRRVHPLPAHGAAQCGKKDQLAALLRIRRHQHLEAGRRRFRRRRAQGGGRRGFRKLLAIAFRDDHAECLVAGLHRRHQFVARRIGAGRPAKRIHGFQSRRQIVRRIALVEIRYRDLDRGCRSRRARTRRKHILQRQRHHQDKDRRHQEEQGERVRVAQQQPRFLDHRGDESGPLHAASPSPASSLIRSI